ncbi:MAG: hypothetical protein RIS34_1800 [Pseudomonadota bacterium]|jgi:hypothetical protein
MIHTFVVFAHLIATCAAIGTIVITDLRLLAKVLGYRVVIPRPERFETIMISVALAMLYLTGGTLLWLGLESNPQYLSNGKLQGKLILVAILTANAFVLHKQVFPILSRSKPVSRWKRLEWTTVASAVSLSNSTWFYCAFLGIARAWNNTVSMTYVVSIAVLAWAIIFLMVNAVLLMASRDAPKERPDWIDSVKASLSDFAVLSDRPPLGQSASDRRKQPRYEASAPDSLRDDSRRRTATASVRLSGGATMRPDFPGR